MAGNLGQAAVVAVGKPLWLSALAAWGQVGRLQDSSLHLLPQGRVEIFLCLDLAGKWLDCLEVAGAHTLYIYISIYIYVYILELE